MRRTPLQRKTPMNRGKGILRVRVPVTPTSTHDPGEVALDLTDSPRARAAAAAIANRQRSIENGSPAYRGLEDLSKRARTGDGSFSPRTRAIITERDRGHCARCGVTAGLTFQHRINRGMGGTSDPVISSPANGILLCGSGTTGCHGWVEANPEAAEKLGYAVPTYLDPATVPVWFWGHGWMFVASGRAHAQHPPEDDDARLVADRRNGA